MHLPVWANRFLFRLWLKRQSVPAELSAMLSAFAESPSFKNASPYWRSLLKQSVRELKTSGLENFKQTVARHYFLLVKWKRFAPNYRKLIAFVKEGDTISFFELLKQHRFLDAESSITCNLFTYLLLQYAERLPRWSEYQHLSEPSLGNPPAIMANAGRPVSSDLLNSIIDFDAVSSSLDMARVSSVMEVGGGYGRDAYVFSKLLNLKRYIMVDIAPTLYVAQEYMAAVFPQKKVFRFREFSSFTEVQKAFEESELVFLMPHQVALLPRKTADLILAIDCLHEMEKEQVRKYFDAFEKTGTYLFMKCWQKTGSQYFQWGHYPVHAGWKELLNRETVVPADYFEALYRL